MITELNERSRTIFRHLVDAYVSTGAPVGSRTLARLLDDTLSPATIRNVMADLEDAGLLYAPHTSAGRLPTQAGLRIFVDGILEVGDLTREERENIESQCAAAGRNIEELLREASNMLSGLSSCASLVKAPKAEAPIRHFEFVPLAPGRCLAVLVGETGVVENRIVNLPLDLPTSVLTEATNYLNARLAGRTLGEAIGEIRAELAENQQKLDAITSRLIEDGLATWTGDGRESGLIVRGHGRLLEDVNALGDLERVRLLFTALETQKGLVRLLNEAERADGVQIFIGAETELFNLAGFSMIVAPFGEGAARILGAIGVIGPTRLNYARIIPMVDYTAKVISRMVG